MPIYHSVPHYVYFHWDYEMGLDQSTFMVLYLFRDIYFLFPPPTFREKKLLVSSEDYGRDLTGVQNLRKKHKRLEAELAAHEPAIQVRNLLIKCAFPM